VLVTGNGNKKKNSRMATNKRKDLVSRWGETQTLIKLFRTISTLFKVIGLTLLAHQGCDARQPILKPEKSAAKSASPKKL
jgi:hypothetical protein